MTYDIPIGWGLSTSGTSWPNTASLYTNNPPQILDTLFGKMVTVVKPGERVIVCVDLEVTDAQIREIQEELTDRGFDGIVLRGARAGVGFKGNPQNMTREETRVDTLARILELWQQCPELKLTSLLEWYHGEEMNDEDFAAAVEVHFQKVTGNNI